MGVLTNLDLGIFIGSLVIIMVIGLWVGRKEDTSDDYFLAGRKTRWWGVAGSIFGSNVSANHLVGMMGVGFAVGFAQAHFEITAIVGLLALCYLFLPVYRKLNLHTLSEYLGRRYDDRCRLAYAIIMIVIMVVIQMVPGFYIGSRSVNILLQGGGQTVDATDYRIGILIMAVVTGSYTIFGGLKAVIATDVIQSVLLLLGGLVVAYVTFSQSEVGGWAGMASQDAASNGGVERLHLYNPANHPKLPWTGVLSGLMILHFYYWGTNQFIVQRALAARSLKEARIGIIAAGFFKLLIPFFSIGTGIAAWYYFQKTNVDVAQDAVFTTLLTKLIAPIGFGLVGLIAAGVIGAILSSLDSMMNSAATIVTYDIYKRYFNKEASEKKLIMMGRIWIGIFIIFAGFLTVAIMDPNSKDSFFLMVATHQGNLVAGVVVAFLVGMVWKGATAPGALVSIVGGVVLCYTIPLVYDNFIGTEDSYFGPTLNAFHTPFIAAVICLVLHIVISLKTANQVTEEKSKLTWSGLELFDPKGFRAGWLSVVLALGVFAILAIAMVFWSLTPMTAGLVAAVTVFALFVLAAKRDEGTSMIANDKFWGGLLGGCAVFLMYYFY